MRTRHAYWMRESAHWADSAITGSDEDESRVKSMQILS